MSHTLLQYYGADWLASLMAIAMIWSLGNGQKIGFVFGMIANLSWIAFAIIAGSLPVLLANFIFFVLNVRGWRTWTAKKSTQNSMEKPA